MRIYNTPAVNLRMMPSFSSPSLGWINKGASCQILEESTVGDSLWYRVKITSVTVNKVNLKGMTGWSLAEFIDPVDASIEESAAATADQLSETDDTHKENQSEEENDVFDEDGSNTEDDEVSAFG